MKTNFLIILTCAFALQINASDLPLNRKVSPRYSKKSKNIFMKEDGGDRTSQHVVKINIFPLFVKYPMLQYEFGFHKNMSAALTFGYLAKIKIPDIIFTPSENANGMKEGYDLPKFGGWSVTPEFRFYPGKKEEHQAPHGFYLALYGRYSSFKLSADYWGAATRDANGNTLTTRLYKTSATFASFTGGLMMGSQWIINEHFSIDWWIGGGGTGKGKLTLEAHSDDPSLNMSGQEQTDLENDIKENLGELQYFSNGAYTIETTPNSAKVVIKGIPAASYRFGLCFGYAF